MLFTGTHPRTLDDKNRLILPKRIREELGATERIFVTPGPDQCLWIFAQQDLEQLAHKLDQAPATDAEARVFRRLFFAQMEAVDLDKTGRVLIPDRLARFAELEKEVVLIGVRDHLELWDRAAWEARREELMAHSPEIALRAKQARQQTT